jgi:hypothetical protein
MKSVNWPKPGYTSITRLYKYNSYIQAKYNILHSESMLKFYYICTDSGQKYSDASNIPYIFHIEQERKLTQTRLYKYNQVIQV